MIDREGQERLWLWFQLSRASFAVIPRVLMHEMPDEWQGKMADLLFEADATFPKAHSTFSVRTTDESGKLIKTPSVLQDYRHPDKHEIEKMRG